MRAARRCRMDLTRVIAEEFSADGAFAFASKEFSSLPAANCVELNEPLAAGQYERIVANFAERGARCLRWTVPSADPALVDRGAKTSEIVVMRLANWSRAAALPTAMVLQARAATIKIEKFLTERLNNHPTAVTAKLLQVDDPQDEWLIAMQAGRAVASAAVLTSGDAGLLHDVFALVGSEAAGRELIDRVVEFAARAGLRHVVTIVPVADTSMYRSVGFVEIGRLIEHVLP